MCCGLITTMIEDGQWKEQTYPGYHLPRPAFAIAATAKSRQLRLQPPCFEMDLRR